MNGGSPLHSPLVLAIETSCDETAVAILDGQGQVLASEIASQIEIHRAYGGVVPEVASRNHLLRMSPVLEAALARANVSLSRIDAFAATAGPGLAGCLLIGNATAKALALAQQKPYLAVNHLEGHLLSPFVANPSGPRPCVALLVSGGHTLLIQLSGVGEYQRWGRTRDDAAGEAFDKVAKMLGLPYPGGPEIEKAARTGRRDAYTFPRGLLDSGDFDFSFSGLKTSVLYTLAKLPGTLEDCRADLCASFQEAVIDVLLRKTLRLAKKLDVNLVTVSGGVSCNARLRQVFAEACAREGRELLLPTSALATDNAAMIAYAALQRLLQGQLSSLEEDIDPNLPLSTAPPLEVFPNHLRIDRPKGHCARGEGRQTNDE